jgi:hypothetical protein
MNGVNDPYFATSRFSWLRWLSKLTCECGGEWSQWEKKSVEICRPPDYPTVDLIRNAGFEPSESDFKEIITYQERRCTQCGKFQQETLKLS